MKMAIFGLARSGLSALRFLSTTDHECFAVNRGEPESWESFKQVSEMIPAQNCVAEEDALELFAQMDLIVKSPGIPYGHPALAKAQENKVEIISEIELAFRCSDIPVVAVTGTNGKTTTATMITELFERLGKKVFLGGNIGIPYSEILNREEIYDWAVVEVSSFQLENIKSFHPKMAVLTNISPSHGERYDSHELYRDAKLKLFQNMGPQDLALIPKSMADLNLPCDRKTIQKLEGFDFSRSEIKGAHNYENIFCAFACALRLCSEEEVRHALQTYIDEFKSVPYRIEKVRELEGLRIYNDGKSTNMASTLAAVDSFPGERLHLVLGGKLRDLQMDFSELIQRQVEKVYAFGEARDFIEQKLSGSLPVEKFATLEELFERLGESAIGGVLLFSPAFPSFDLYNNYEERAKAFNKLADKL